MSEFRRVHMPMSREDARSLRAGDMILVDGEIVITAGLPTVQRLVACAESEGVSSATHARASKHLFMGVVLLMNILN